MFQLLSEDTHQRSDNDCNGSGNKNIVNSNSSNNDNNKTKEKKTWIAVFYL